MSTIEDRLGDLFDSAADSIAATPLRVDRPIARAAQRRRNRRMGGALLGMVAVLAVGAAALRLAAGGDQPLSTDAVTDGDPTATSTPDGSAPPAPGPQPDADAEGGAVGDGSPGPTQLPADTGPELAWRQAEVPDGLVPIHIVWSGTSFVALAIDEARGAPSVLVSSDGAAWSSAGDLPAGATPSGLAVSDGRLIAWGGEGAAEAGPFGSSGGPVRVSVSDDDGATWSEVGSIDTLDGAPDTDGPYLTHHFVAGVAAVGDRVVAVVGTTRDLDLDAILTAAGYDVGPGGGAARGWGFDSGTGAGYVDYCPTPLDADGGCAEPVKLSLDELGITDEVFMGLAVAGDATLYASVAGGPFELLDDVIPGEGWPTGLVSSQGSFALAISGENGSALLTSADGTSWTPADLGDSEVEINGIEVNGDVLVALGWTRSGSGSLVSADGGQTWQEQPALPVSVHDIAVGPGGSAVTGTLDVGFVEPIVVEKDGYAVSFGDEVSVVDLATGETIVTYGPEEQLADEPPAGVVEDEGPPWTLTFLHPDTGEELVTVTDADMVEAFGIDSDGDGIVAPPDHVVGWSADDVGWGWQTATEAFDVNGPVELAVGERSVVAVVSTDEPGGASVHVADLP